MPYQVTYRYAYAKWCKMALSWINELNQLFPKGAKRVAHIGSTSVPRLPAKPVVDLLLECHAGISPDLWVKPLQASGWTYVPHFNEIMPHRRFFCKLPHARPCLHKSDMETYGVDLLPIAHLHVFEFGHEAVNMHLDFCKKLRTNKRWRLAYAQIKKRLEIEHFMNSVEYSEAKSRAMKPLLERMLI